MIGRVARMLLWLGLAAVAGWCLLPASVESLDAAARGLAEEVVVRCSDVGETLKLAGGVAVLVALWRWTTPRPPRYGGSRRRPYRSP